MLIFSKPVQAEHNNFSIETSLNSGDGYLDYTINDSTGDWQSKLEFPLDYSSVKIKFKNEFKNCFLKETNFSFKKNINEPSDPFIDSDWLNIEFDSEPNIYAETKAEVDSFIFDLNYILSDYNIGNIYFGGGYSYSQRNYIMSGGYQNDYINMVRTEFADDLEVIEYDNEISNPYFSINYMTDNEKINLETIFKYSPYVNIKDFDNHILRDKTAESKTYGTGFKMLLNFNYELNKNFNIVIGYKYNQIETEGTQTQTFSDGSTAKVDQEINLNNNSYNIGLNYTF